MKSFKKYLLAQTSNLTKQIKHEYHFEFPCAKLTPNK